MPIYELSIPVDNYYGEAVFFQTFFFEADKSPTKEEVLSYLKEQSDFVKNDPEPESNIGGNVFEECIESINNITSNGDSWPNLFSYLSQTNVRTMHPKWGDQPLTMRLLNPVKL